MRRVAAGSTSSAVDLWERRLHGSRGMRRRFLTSCVAALLIATLPMVIANAKDDEASVRVRPSFSPAPATLRITAVVDADERNRNLVVEIDSEDFYRSSTRPLNGESAAHIHDLIFRAVPEGNYEVRSTVLRSDGTRVTRLSRAVVGVPDDPTSFLR